MRKSVSLCALVFAVLLGFNSPAFADPVVLDGVIGSTVSFDADIQNPIENVDTLFLNGSSFTIDSPLSLNDLLMVNFPPSIAAGDEAFGTLFTVALPVGLTPGLYNGTYLILGGFTPSDQETLAEIDFQINAQPAASPIPEPGTWVLLLTGTGALGMMMYGRRRQMSLVRAA
ncbi:MAG TPA: PEP-CTERM sorting domain-containing protein [Edaphobacter sp.]|nr:PEP-CTERM sorting domain-containing protein [Edaphobacter sp.]